MRLIIATKNNGKFREIKKILSGLKIELIYLGDLKEQIEIKEGEESFLANALIKALAVSRAYNFDLIAGEDSGLEVNHLGNRPGVESKRYAGEYSDDYVNNIKLLDELNGVVKSKRQAHFSCTIALVRGGKLLKSFQGRLSGYINNRMIGHSGFGYDPLFYLPAYKKTIAQLPLKEKNKISHRAKAFSKLKKFLANYLKDDNNCISQSVGVMKR